MPKSRDGRLNQTDLASYVKLSKKTISDHVKAGVIKLDDDGLIDPERAIKMMRQKLHPKAKADLGQHNQRDGSVDYHTAKTAREIAEAKISNLKFKEMEGSLIDRSLVKRIYSEDLRQFRDGLSICSRRISPELIGIDDSMKIQEILNKEFRLLLEEFADNPPLING